MREKIGECLVRAGLITDDDLQDALAEHTRTGERLGVVLVRKNLATEKQVAKALASQLGFAYVSLADDPPDPMAVGLISKDVALEHACIALRLEKDVLIVAMSDPLLFGLVEDLEVRTGHRIKQVVATRGDIVAAIQSGFVEETRVPAVTRPLTADGSDADGDASIDALIALLVKTGIERKASDVHIEPSDEQILVRVRLDGILKDAMRLAKPVQGTLIARLKGMAGLDVAETRLPQEGRLRVTAEDGTEIDFRMSILRTLFGERIVLRSLESRRNVFALEDLGLSVEALRQVRELVHRQQGLLLVAGPAGSGKTTTLGSVLKAIQSEGTNIVTIEDPIEYRIPGVTQTQVDDATGPTFNDALSSMARQDADVIAVDGIRDGATARGAMQLARNGRLVIATLMADDAASAIGRLAAMDVEPSAIADALVGVIAQRLVRRLCVACRRPGAPSAEVLRALNVSGTDSLPPLFDEVGCDQCNHIGYRGRIGIYEVLRVTEKVRHLIAAGATEDGIREAAAAGGTISLGEDGVAKVASGVTTPEELLRVVPKLRVARPLCPACGAVVDVDFCACPKCGRRLGRTCPHCGRAMQADWMYCPYCAQSAGPAKPARQPGRSDGGQRRDEPPAPGSRT